MSCLSVCSSRHWGVIVCTRFVDLDLQGRRCLEKVRLKVMFSCRNWLSSDFVWLRIPGPRSYTKYFSRVWHLFKGDNRCSFSVQAWHIFYRWHLLFLEIIWERSLKVHMVMAIELYMFHTGSGFSDSFSVLFESKNVSYQFWFQWLIFSVIWE